MTSPFSDYRHGMLIADGDWQFELVARGWPRDVPIECAAIKRPELIRDVAEAFIDGGVSILTSPTAKAHSHSGIEIAPDILAAMNQEAVRILASAVSDASDRKCRIFGMIGPPSGLLLLGELSEDDLCDAYRAQASALAADGAEAIICESFTELEVLRLCVSTVAEATGLPVIGSLKFDSGEHRTETSLGVTPPQACAMLMDAGAAGVGCDASEDPDGTAAVIKLIREACDLPVWVRIDAGVPQLSEGGVIFPESPDIFSARLSDLRTVGANFVAGGRGASVRHMAALVTASQAKETAKPKRKA